MGREKKGDLAKHIVSSVCSELSLGKFTVLGEKDE
jgi:hypothetical protein